MITTAAGQDAGAVREAGVNPRFPYTTLFRSASGTLTSSDVDHGATATWSGSASSTYGAFAINAATGAWTYTLDNRSEERRVGQKQREGVTDGSTTTKTDEHGATATAVATTPT